MPPAGRSRKCRIPLVEQQIFSCRFVAILGSIVSNSISIRSGKWPRERNGCTRLFVHVCVVAFRIFTYDTRLLKINFVFRVFIYKYYLYVSRDRNFFVGFFFTTDFVSSLHRRVSYISLSSPLNEIIDVENLCGKSIAECIFSF